MGQFMCRLFGGVLHPHTTLHNSLPGSLKNSITSLPPAFVEVYINVYYNLSPNYSGSNVKNTGPKSIKGKLFMFTLSLNISK